MKAYKQSDASKPPETRFVRYKPKRGDIIALNTQPRDMRFWEQVNAYVRGEPMADRDRFFYARLKDLGIEKGKLFKPSAAQKDILMRVLHGPEQAYFDQSFPVNKIEKTNSCAQQQD